VQRFSGSIDVHMDTRLIVFAQAPVPGQVKTRLHPGLSPIEAVALHRDLVVRALSIARTADIGPLELCCAPDASHPFFAECADRFGARLLEQGRGDLGARMGLALSRALRSGTAAVLIGTDCPALTAGDLSAAAERLLSRDEVVLVPSDRGGYVLIGVRRPVWDIFRDVEWGSAGVMATTRRRLRAAGTLWHEMAPVWELDRASDYPRYLSLVADEQQVLARAS